MYPPITCNECPADISVEYKIIMEYKRAKFGNNIIYDESKGSNNPTLYELYSDLHLSPCCCVTINTKVDNAENLYPTQIL
jgi:hypothetical protein